jgi:hypothetical protein
MMSLSVDDVVVTSVAGVNVVFGRCSSPQAPTHTADATTSVTLTVQDPARFPLGVHTTLDSISTPPMALLVK